MSNKNKKKKKGSWVKKRHRAVVWLLNLFLTPIVRIKYHVKIERFKEIKNRQFFVISNHQTGFDQFFTSIACYPTHLYYFASEDLFSKGFVSRLIKFLVNPIPFMKSTSDVSAILNCKRIVKEGGSIGLFPEGNRTYDGKLGYVKPTVASLVKALKLPLAIFRIEGGYGIHPRWSDVTRKGKMRAYVSRVVEPEEYSKMTDDELFELIINEMNVDDTVIDGEFKHKKNAEFLERALYLCPECGLSRFESHKDTFTCKNCGLSVRHLPTKELEAIKGNLPFKTVSEWYQYQNNYISTLDLSKYFDSAAYLEKARFTEVVPNKKQNLIAKNASVALFGNKIVIKYKNNEQVFDFNNVHAMTVLGKNKLDIYIGDKIYQLKGDKRFNAVKFVNFFYRFSSVYKEVKNGRALGL